MPIYSGCPNVSDFFGDRGYIKFDINNYESLKVIIHEILDNPEANYNKYITDLREVKKILMEKENIVAFIADHLRRNTNSEYREYTIKPLEQTRGYKYQMLRIRIHRFLFKVFSKLFA